MTTKLQEFTQALASGPRPVCGPIFERFVPPDITSDGTTFRARAAEVKFQVGCPHAHQEISRPLSALVVSVTTDLEALQQGKGHVMAVFGRC